MNPSVVYMIDMSIIKMHFPLFIDKAAAVADKPAEKRLQAVKQRRVADREARRTRRRQARQVASDRSLTEPHHDGLSSDDEESKSDQIKYQGERGE